MKKKKTIIQKVTIDPERGLAALAVGMTPEGYTLKKMDRKGAKATLTFIRT